MTRNDFFKKLGRYLLLVLIAIIAVSLGKKIVSGDACTACPGKGFCNGKADCNKY
jgi:hypothetical protein